MPISSVNSSIRARSVTSGCRYYQIAYWIYQTGTFVSIVDIAKEFGLSRASLYREIDKILDCKSDIKVTERRCKVITQWHRQLCVHSMNMEKVVSNTEGETIVSIFYPLIWNELTTKRWRCVDIYKIIVDC